MNHRPYSRSGGRDVGSTAAAIDPEILFFAGWIEE